MPCSLQLYPIFNFVIRVHCKHLLAALLYYHEVGAPKTAAGPTPSGASTDLEAKIADLYK
jgi:hypothetical protein